jgi:ABC-type multidrug transport system ATPase subunit
MQELDPEGRLDFMQALQALHAQSEVAVVVSDPFWRQLLPFTQRVDRVGRRPNRGCDWPAGIF